MNIIRYQTAIGQIAYGRLHADGRATRRTGDLFNALTNTSEPASVAKLLASIEPRDMICIDTLTNPVIAEGANG